MNRIYVAALIFLAGLSALSKDLSLGELDSRGREIPFLSIRQERDFVRVRFAPGDGRNEILCRRIRKDLCGDFDGYPKGEYPVKGVKYVEVVFPKKDCGIEKATLALCYNSSFVQTTVKVVFEDKRQSPIALQNTKSSVDIFEIIKRSEKNLVTYTRLTFLVVGGYSNGEEELISARLGQYDPLQVLNKSLFDKD